MPMIGSRAGGASGRIALIALFAAVIAMSALNSALRTDAHHWGLMLSNALDLSDGRVPYRDFIIQYGFLTTLVQSWWGGVFGFSFLSFGILTAFVYCGLLYQVFAVIRYLSTPGAAALFLAVAFILHPFPIYPWSDYYAGFFMSCAVALLYTQEETSQARLIAAGALLGLAVWSRYTYVVAIVPFLILVLVAKRYSLRSWLTVVLSFAATNSILAAAFEYGYGIHLIDALTVLTEVAEGHGTRFYTLERITNLVAVTRVEDGFLPCLWVATLPLFLQAARTKRLSGRQMGAYATLSALGWINLVHAIRIFEYFRVINASFALAIVSFWMIGDAVHVVKGQGNDEGSWLGRVAAFIRKAPLILVIPLAFVAFLSVRVMLNFPLATFNLDHFLGKERDPYRHLPGIWRDLGPLNDLTLGKVGRVCFTHSGMLDFYRALSSEICGKGTIFNFTLENVDYVAGQMCDRQTKVRIADVDKYLRVYDQSDYRRVYLLGELSRNDIIISTGTLFEDVLCLNKTNLFTPYLEYVASAGTLYVLRSNCVGKMTFGRGWWPSRRFAMDRHAEIHLMNHGSRPLRVKYKLTLGTFKRQNMTIRLNNSVQKLIALIPDHPTQIRSFELRLPPGNNLLQFDVDGPPKSAADPSPVHLTFELTMRFLALSEE